MPTEKQNSELMFAMLKQLHDHHKWIDWNRVAEDVGISKGHAARMRWTRYRTNMDPATAPSLQRKHPPYPYPSKKPYPDSDSDDPKGRKKHQSGKSKGKDRDRDGEKEKEKGKDKAANPRKRKTTHKAPKSKIGFESGTRDVSDDDDGVEDTKAGILKREPEVYEDEDDMPLSRRERTVGPPFVKKEDGEGVVKMEVDEATPAQVVKKERRGSKNSLYAKDQATEVRVKTEPAVESAHMVVDGLGLGAGDHTSGVSTDLENVGNGGIVEDAVPIMTYTAPTASISNLTLGTPSPSFSTSAAIPTPLMQPLAETVLPANSDSDAAAAPVPIKCERRDSVGSTIIVNTTSVGVVPTMEMQSQGQPEEAIPQLRYTSPSPEPQHHFQHPDFAPENATPSLFSPSPSPSPTLTPAPISAPAPAPAPSALPTHHPRPEPTPIPAHEIIKIEETDSEDEVDTNAIKTPEAAALGNLAANKQKEGAEPRASVAGPSGRTNLGLDGMNDEARDEFMTDVDVDLDLDLDAVMDMDMGMDMGFGRERGGFGMGMGIGESCFDLGMDDDVPVKSEFAEAFAELHPEVEYDVV
ncbi:hypothetical protein K402DRAFT_467643 [Aulographum hederae CBS 113979]|uniref:Myb-like DNA-binding domain-containing protein n=1 Tax=Aulographum hederae CBS 113979 TaxID=1176131 RepID=A0A6G1GKQ5_9PEZI|nr:hypothetical protein K402DRAFT_467643 [Aulographum hederae CBS 113979]